VKISSDFGVFFRFGDRDLSRFWAKVSVRGPGECWEWTAAKFRKGYGSFYCLGFGRGKVHGAHRVSWAIANERVPRRQVLHTCDNKVCVNPSHLYEGTHADNMRDARERGTVSRSARKLTDVDVSLIRYCRQLGFSVRKLAVYFPVSRSSISRICTGVSYPHVDGPVVPAWGSGRSANFT